MLEKMKSSNNLFLVKLNLTDVSNLPRPTQERVTSTFQQDTGGVGISSGVWKQ